MCVLHALSWDNTHFVLLTIPVNCFIFFFLVWAAFAAPLYITMCYKTSKIDNWWVLKTTFFGFKNIKMLLNILFCHRSWKERPSKECGKLMQMTSGYFQDGGPLISRPSPPSKMATESNFPPGQGTVVDVKIPTRVELHKVKFPWVALPPILGQTIDRCNITTSLGIIKQDMT